MIIVSQNKEKVIMFGTSFNGLEYGAVVKRKKGQEQEIHHKIFVIDGCFREIAEYKTKERCLEVLKEICTTYERERFSDHAFDSAASVQRPYVFIQNTVYEMPQE